MAIGMSQGEANDISGRGTNEGTKLKATSGWNNNGNGTDDYGFSGLPGGWCYHFGDFGDFDYLGNYGIWWSATDYGIQAWFRYVPNHTTRIHRRNYPRFYGFSVRCVRD